MAACDPHWTAYVAALGTPLIALITGLIAYRQWRTARDRLVLDLFDPRFPLYEATLQLFRTVFTSGTLQDKDVTAFLTVVRTSRFLLNTKMEQYLMSSVREKAYRLATLEMEFNLLSGDKKVANIKEQEEIKSWFKTEGNTIDDRFAKFLQLRH